MMADELDQLFDDTDHEAAPKVMRGGREFRATLVVGEPIQSLREFEAQYGGVAPVARVVFCTEAEDGGEQLGGQWPELEKALGREPTIAEAEQYLAEIAAPEHARRAEMVEIARQLDRLDVVPLRSKAGRS
jgi:hypothetical protein